jgi:uncharacterized protein YggT (Ycf19 family)
VPPSAFLLGDAVSVAVRFVTSLYYVYLLLVFVYILLSWIQVPYSIWLSRFQRFLYDVVNPYLALFRRVFPFARVGMFDLTPIIAILSLTAIWRLTVLVIEQLG